MKIKIVFLWALRCKGESDKNVACCEGLDLRSLLVMHGLLVALHVRGPLLSYSLVCSQRKAHIQDIKVPKQIADFYKFLDILDKGNTFVISPISRYLEG